MIDKQRSGSRALKCESAAGLMQTPSLTNRKNMRNLGKIILLLGVLATFVFTAESQTSQEIKTNNAEENALVSEYNRLVSANIPRLDSQRRSLQSKVSDYMSANKMARVWMYRGVYNYCSSVINSHEAFITSLNNLLKRAYGKSPRLVSEIQSQIRSVESGVNRLKEIRYGLVNAL